MILLQLLFLFGAVSASDYFGVPLGSFRNTSYALDAEVFLSNRTHIQIVDLHVKRMINRAQLEFRFYYDTEESGPSAVFEYKTLDKREWLQPNEKDLRDGAVARRIVVVIPSDYSHWKKFGILDVEKKSIISSISLEGVQAPESFCCLRNGTEYYAIEGEYGVKVDPIGVLDSQTLHLPNFNYMGTKPPDGWIFAGRGNEIVQSTGKKALILGRDTENHHCAMHEDYFNQDMIVRLSGTQTIYDIEWISVFCYQYEHDFGHLAVHLDRQKNPVPAYLPPIRTSPPPKKKQKKCL